jgi:hypothetical protein
LSKHRVCIDGIDGRIVNWAQHLAKELYRGLLLKFAPGNQAHAVVEEKNDANGRVAEVELANRAGLPVNAQLEILQLEVGHYTTLRVYDGGRHGD